MSAVTIYTTSWCPYCRAATDLLREKGVAFEEIDVERTPGARSEMIAKAGRTSVPQIFAGERHLGGCDDLYALDGAGKLDALLTASAEGSRA
jgi:glutaredoxin 3